MDVRSWMQLPLEERTRLVGEARRSGGSLVTAVQGYTDYLQEQQQQKALSNYVEQFTPEVGMQEEAPSYEYEESIQEEVMSAPTHYNMRELKTMNPTRSNFDAAKVQEDLYNMGYNLEPTGEWDEVTREALWDWQEKAKM